MFGSAARYGPLTPSVTDFIRRLAVMTPDDWHAFLPSVLVGTTAGMRRTLEYHVDTNMSPAWDAAFLEADRVAEPDRARHWMRAMEDAGNAIAEPIQAGVMQWSVSRSFTDYAVWVASLPNGRDPHATAVASPGLTESEMTDRARAWWAASEAATAVPAAINMAFASVAALVVRDRLSPTSFRMLYWPFLFRFPPDSLAA